MPGISGIEWLEELRSDEVTKQLPVILVTALSDTRDVVRGLELGANDYIAKPLDMRILIARVRSHLALKHLMDEREETITQLTELGRLRSNLFRIVSHDLKNPLNNIRMAEHILREKHKSPDDKPFLDTIKKTVDSMQHVINDFLELIEVESNRTKITIKTVSVNDIINDTLAQYEVSAKAKNVTLISDDYSFYVYADFNRLKQVVGNLVSNAIKYSPFDKKIQIKCVQNGETLRILIEDEGPGVKEEERSELFKEFGNTSNRPTNNETSTGLGLWIVKYLMTLQNGHVGADFPESGGAIFWVELPLVNNPEVT